MQDVTDVHVVHYHNLSSGGPLGTWFVGLHPNRWPLAASMQGSDNSPRQLFRRRRYWPRGSTPRHFRNQACVLAVAFAFLPPLLPPLQVRQLADSLDDADVAAISALPGLMGMSKVYRAGDDADSQMYGKKNTLAVAMILFTHMTPDQVAAMLGIVVPGEGERVAECAWVQHAKPQAFFAVGQTVLRALHQTVPECRQSLQSWSAERAARQRFSGAQQACITLSLPDVQTGRCRTVGLKHKQSTQGCTSGH